MKKKSTSQSAFFNLRVLIAAVFCLGALAVAPYAQTRSARPTQQSNRSVGAQDAPGTQTPDVVRLMGPVIQNNDLRSLPYVAPNAEIEEKRLTRYPHPEIPSPTNQSAYPRFETLVKQIAPPTPTMPAPLLTFDGMNSSQSGCLCLPPDTDGDVGPNHYVQSVNSSIKIFDKNGNPLNGPNGTTYNSFFLTLVGTPCSGFNNGDGFVFYDHQADRWVVSDFAFPGSLPGSGPFYQCIGVSQTSDPVSGGWFLYAIQHDPSNPTWIGDYPKLAMWNSGGSPAQNAYYLTVNLFNGVTLGFQGVRVFALDRASMLTGGAANTIAFNITPAGLGDSYSLVPAGFRTGTPPPAGRDEFLISVDSPASGGVTLTQVHGWKFHVDFSTPTNSTLGLGVNHTPNANVTVAGFIDAFTSTGTLLVPQNGTAQKLDTLGDKIMTPLVYQNRSGTESLWASQTVILNYPNGPTAIRWYQMNVTGGNFPGMPAQQQSWTNGNDGLWRWMPSIAVDQNGNMAIAYSTSSATQEPSVRYAGRLASDPLNNLGQGEAVMTVGGGHQTHSSGRWGDYSMLTIDPADNLSFWHTNEYYPVTSSANWFTRIGKFQFPPGPTPTPTPTVTPTATPTATATATPTPTATPAPTIQVIVQTSPTGRTFSVDGTTYSSTQTFSWTSGSSHTIATTSPQSGSTGVRYIWMNWTGGGAISHTVAPTTNETYTATFRTQYFLTMSHGTGGTVSPGSGWKNSGATVSISATPTNNNQVSYIFSNWTGSGAGSYSGTNNPASITMNGPITENASFTQNNVQVTVQTNPAGLSFSVDGTPYTTAQTFSWQPGSSHTIVTTSPQSGGTGVRYLWSSWSGGGAISHTVAPTTNKTYTATFATQYYLTMNHGTGGTVAPPSGWKNSGAVVSISATPASGYSFSSWSGSGTGSYSGSTNPSSITIGGPITETAAFRQ